MVKNILIISKFDLFKEQPSNNRVHFLKFLATKSNIKIMNDGVNVSLKKWLDSTKKRVNWVPDIIIYYFLSVADVWVNISIKDFNSIIPNTPRFMIFEDHYYYEMGIKLYKKYKFKMLIKPTKHLPSEKKYQLANVKFKIWDFYFDKDIFKNYSKGNFKYHLLLYGFIHPDAYPLRLKYFQVLKFLNEKSNLRIKYIHHPGYFGDEVKKLPKNEELSKIISEARFTLVSSSVKKLFLKKYYEVPLSGSTIIGDIPEGYNKDLNDKIISLDYNSNHNQIIQKIKEAVNNKHLNIEKNSRIWGEKLRDSQTFEKGYIKLNQLLN